MNKVINMPFKKLLSSFKINNKISSSVELPVFEKLNMGYDIIFHIGSPKTGSSIIQNFLLSNRIKLEDIGFYYPEHGLDENGISGGHSNLGLNLSKSEFAEAKTILDNYIAEAKTKNLTLLISAESLFNHPEKLKKIIGDKYICKIISFFRDPMKAIFSNYNQTVKRHFTTSSFETYCQHIINNNSNSLTGEIFNKWSEYFEKHNLIVIGYDPIFFKKITIQELFLRTLGIDKTTVDKLKPKETKFINKSYITSALELKRILNFVLDKENNKENNKIDWFLQKLSDETNESAMSLNVLCETTKKQLQLQFEPTNLKLKENYLIEISPGFLEKSQVLKYKQENYTKKLLDIIKLLSKIEEYKPDSYKYIVECTRNTLQNENPAFDVLKLAEWLEIPNIKYDEKLSLIQSLNKTIEKQKEQYNKLTERLNNTINDMNSLFNENQIHNMSEGNYKEADFLRDIASLLIKRKDYSNAEIIINRALIIRPHGPAIIKIKDKILKLKPNGDKE